MKGGGGGGGLSVTGKWRWRGLVIGVLFLVILSMLVHLAFLLGVRNGFHSPNPNGYVPVQHTSVSNGDNDRSSISNANNDTENDRSVHINEIVAKLAPKLSKDVLRKSTAGTENQTTDRNVMQSGQHKEALPVEPHTVLPPPPNTIDTSYAAKIEGTDVKGGINENENCDLKFGSYCLWRKEHREDMKDSMVKKLKDQLFVARAYYPSIAKLPSQSRLTRELRQNIQELERVLSESATDANLPQEIGEKSQKTEAAIVRAKSFPVDCNNIDRKLRQIFDLTEGEASFHMKQNAFLYRLAVQTMPKSLHCLSMKLTVEYFKSPYLDLERSQADKYSDPLLHHYVIFSNNVLASSVVINSTVMHSKESESQVFHVLTDEQNYFAMKLWFFRNAFKEATVQVLNIEKFSLDYYDKATLSHLLLPVEFRVSFRNVDDSSTQERTQYLSVFSDVHYLLPEIFQSLEKVVVLDDDVVVQKDLSVLWNLDMGGKVNGAVQFCSVTLGLLKSYLGEKNFNKNSCAWMSGLNLVDLARWRELDLTKTYRKMAREVSLEEESIEAAALPASLLTFQDLIYALDGVGALSGLGHDYGLDVQTIKQAAVLHYNGNMKPWLELGIPRYKQYWKKFLNPEDQFLSECNVHA
ncbi:probable galacturonosyltransferase 7 isoform X2 [Mangifera indica]|uniref:probable galacturonosyltransferase 7 isoform X2 n=1 Tax=Mangifera indica TaxID=29780 RepID=UPI001CF968DA|nr:probable galacturonosyltransferase 7 isoform X2 [Mangifera indica]